MIGKRPETLTEWLVSAMLAMLYGMVGFVALVVAWFWVQGALGHKQSAAERLAFAASEFRRECREYGFDSADFTGPRTVEQGKDYSSFVWALGGDQAKTITVSVVPGDSFVADSEALSRDMQLRVQRAHGGQ